jgi:peptidoglycan hydrolase-like protein with peptidoglycan-binding domain
VRRVAVLIGVLSLALPAAGTGARTGHAKVFFLQGEQLSAVPRSLGADAKPLGAIRALIAGPTTRERNAGYRSAIPAGSRLVRFSATGKTAIVSLRTPAQKPGSFTQSLLPARGAEVAFTLRALGFRHVSLFVNGHTIATPSSAEPSIPPPDQPPDLRPDVPAPADVLLVQTQLNSIHFLPKDAITGIWDYRTEMAVIGAQAWNGLERDGIVGPQTQGALASGVLPSATVQSPGRHIEVYRGLGVTLLVQDGAVLRAIHVSSGRSPGFQTPAGTFTVFRKERFSWSVPYKVWLPYASYFHNGVAFHAYPEIPATPASHGCVRVSYPEAATVYAFAKLGTTVYVY